MNFNALYLSQNRECERQDLDLGPAALCLFLTSDRHKLSLWLSDYLDLDNNNYSTRSILDVDLNQDLDIDLNQDLDIDLNVDLYLDEDELKI